MHMHIPFVNTRDFSYTLNFLKEKFPSVLSTKCFNSKNLPFVVEVEQTEVGHLFEHVLLDQLCFMKMDNGSNRAEFSGRTSWNWEKDPIGVFHITLNLKKQDLEFLNAALKKTIALIESLLSSYGQPFSRTPVEYAFVKS